MNKAKFIERLATKTKLTKVQSEMVLDATLEIIQEAVAEGEGVKLVGFGTFGISSRKARTGRNPQTGAEIQIPATKTPGFTAGKTIKRDIK